MFLILFNLVLMPSIVLFAFFMTIILQEWKAEVPSAFAHGPSIIFFGVWDIWLAVLPLYEIFSWLISKSPVNCICTTLFQTANCQKLTTFNQDKRNGHGLHTYKTCQTATCWLLTTVPDTNRSSSFCQGDTRRQHWTQRESSVHKYMENAILQFTVGYA